MARPRTPIGTFGQISFASKTTTVTAHTRFRDYDGRLRPVQATGGTRKQAEHNLKAVLARRSRIAYGSTDLSGDSTFKRLVEIWLEDLDLQELAFSTRELYARDMRTLVLPAFKDYTLREISIMMVDRFLKMLAIGVEPEGDGAGLHSDVIRKRLAEVPADPEPLIFFSRNGTPLSANNVRRTLRAALKEAGLDRVTPHAFRRTVATTLEKEAGAELAAEMLGHTSTVITKKHYIARADAVNEATAEILESLAPRAVQDLAA